MTQENFNYVTGNMYRAIRNEDEFAMIWVVMAAWSVASDENLEV